MDDMAVGTGAVHSSVLPGQSHSIPRTPVTLQTHATVLVSDRNLMVPTVQAALQAARAGRGLTDVIIVTGGMPAAELDTLRAAVASDPITVLDSSREIESLFAEFNFDDSLHYTPTSLARLLLDDILPPQYEHILYLDGDTYLAGDLTDLFALRVPEGQIGASLDSLFLHLGGSSAYAQKLRTYRTKLSSGPSDRYFNAGILAARRSSWKSFGPTALAFYRDHYQDCIYHDQSALNIVCENAVHWFSPKFNFLTDYRLMGFGTYVKPSLYHFSGASKPWNSRVNPWPLGIYDRYQTLLAERPGLAVFETPQSAEAKRKVRNRLIAHILNDAPGLKRPTRLVEKHAYFRDYLKTNRFTP